MKLRRITWSSDLGSVNTSQPGTRCFGGGAFGRWAVLQEDRFLQGLEDERHRFEWMYRVSSYMLILE